METPASIGRYRIKRWLTSGAMGDIYEAHDPLIDRPIALKVLRRELLERAEADGWLERFRHEARAAGRLLHPNIVTLLDYGEENGVPFLAMEYIEGESLDQLMKRSGRIGYAQSINIISQVLTALEFAHANSVVHRDIKPANILLAKTGVTKVADFGIAHIEASDLTGEGDVLGTPSYMAPEQLLGKVVDHRADQFAAAAVLFELLSGTKPFHGKSLGESMLNMERRGPTDICMLNGEVPTELKSVIERALAYEPDGRFPSSAEFLPAIVAASQKAASAPGTSPRADETVISPVSVVPPPSASAPTMTPPPSLADAAGPHPLAVELLAEVETDLASFIGPIARSIVRRAAKKTVDLANLYQTVAGYIDAPGDREFFISSGARRMQSVGRNATSASLRLANPTLTVDPEVLRQVEVDLTEYIGPIATVVMRRLLAKSSSLPNFYQDLAAHIPNERDRSNFLNSRLGTATRSSA